ncbi:preprotein translocase subunit SecE [Clostridium formicaceticum]|uniref:Protein translocase subunit SecE n=1 Tax=Clostridium formicaceticum TaxID=1497 RepID=A0AAC9RRL7_9CLOT|nr:preprotein translocase subunit SecE [Clostridium formicaceticum]AOY75118.1 preprotein translocase subunit SecE [Clostridium formicaceticum]ARE89543.1 preprotein translocase subunit SecE [Clostridium formicaceticum]
MTTQANTNTKAGSLGKYLRGVKSELKKVNWPNGEELKNNTSVVIASCLLATILLWALDTFFGFGLNLIIK